VIVGIGPVAIGAAQEATCCCGKGRRRHPRAEACFTQALQVAREQAGKFSELQAARDLAALWAGQLT
jgi:hypothetical protein